ncbi:MAG: DUF294 nucleotidyltransferase-like domain-containing protein [Rhodocyclaceae bacterium]|nr:DUF294 nucleotidyltransferase-like domain-containing protein [Rhodocyclaceae bacterium]
MTRPPPLNLHTPLAAFVRRTPVTAAPETPLREVVEMMAGERVGSVVVVESESQRPIGIFTLRDLLRLVAAGGLDLDTMVAGAMTDSGLIMLHWRSTAYQAEIMLARHGVHHVIVVDATGRLAGIVSQSDILDLQRGGIKAIAGAIRSARDMEALCAAAEDIRRIARQMLNDGSAAEALTQSISTLNDQLALRILELTRLDFALPKVRWCWVALGSEGRFEQTLSTDQDNGILFDAAADADIVRAALLPFAREVNARLAHCGFPLCKGEIMAGNPALCLSLSEWKERFNGWLRCTNPDALLNATIYFDFRPIYGDENLAEALRAWLCDAIPEESAFLRLMAENAVRAQPPLGLIREFAFDDNAVFPHTLDLKAFGARPFVDAARTLALAHGVAATSTAERLRELQRQGTLGNEDVEAIIDGFYFIQALRLRQQHGETIAGGENRIDPDTLNELDRNVLKIAFRQARKLQQKLQLEYRV